MTLPRGRGGGGGAAVVVCVRKGECGGALDQWRGRGRAVCAWGGGEGGKERERKRGGKEGEMSIECHNG